MSCLHPTTLRKRVGVSVFYKIGDVTVISVEDTMQRLLKSEWYKKNGQHMSLAKNNVRRVVDEVDIVFTAAEIELLDWARRAHRAVSLDLREGWYQESYVRHPSGDVPFLDGVVDQEDFALALAFQSMEREGSALFPREILCRIFCAASPTYRMTCGRWTELQSSSDAASASAATWYFEETPLV